ncbi:Uu.00g131350.m01.CDS01 [Anthostomella pinea]|uniref:Uu.00g131350.m01.CDS01 n=1 Tax=Anthostomella pinea TaxID=933095 RepID=A0AAI8VJK9_9PEZI|nr:Uu.00g131350.m01.CDS01 [Anthostomella pinea]
MLAAKNASSASDFEDATAPSLASPRVVVLTILLAAFLYFYIRRRSQRTLEIALAQQYNCEPVLPRVPYRRPLALDLLKVQFEALFSGHTLEALTDYITIADTVRLELWGVTGYITTDPANIETILSTRFDDYGLGNRRVAAFPLLGEGIFSQDGAPWKHSQDLIRRQFARVQKQTLSVFEPHVNELVETLTDAAAAGNIVDMKPFFFEFTFNTTTQLLFGEPHSSLSREDRDALRDSFDYAALGVGIRVRLADLALLYNPPKFRRACTVVRDWATFFADKALRYKDEVGEEKASENFHLVRNPDILDRVRREVSEIPSDMHITRDQIQRLPFLRCCFSESKMPSSAITFDAAINLVDRYAALRLYPQLALAMWISTEDPGSASGDFALMEASYAVVRVLQAFPNIRLPSEVPNEPVGAERQSFSIALSPTDGVKVLLT